MRLLKEIKKHEIDLKKEIEVALTLQDIAVIYAVMAEESLKSVEETLRDKGLDTVAGVLDVFGNDIPYDLYNATEKVLVIEGLLNKGEF